MGVGIRANLYASARAASDPPASVARAAELALEQSTIVGTI